MNPPEAERQSMEVDVACVGFGPAAAGFLFTLHRAMGEAGDDPAFQSRVMPGMPLQVVCYERGADLGFGVSGAVTRGRGIRASFPDLDLTTIPMAHPVTAEKAVYLLDPIGASRRPVGMKALDRILGGAKRREHHALEFRTIPGFLRKEDGFVLSLGQFNQWVASQIMAGGLIQLWPGMPVSGPILDGDRVAGIRLADQGVERDGRPAAGFMPGMDVRAGLTVVADGPVGPVGRALDDRFGLPEGHHRRDWAVGMKMVIDLPRECSLEPGTVIHTLGFPEPEIFGFLYVYPEGKASLGIFIPSWFDNPIRTAYRYLQHWITHPYVQRFVAGGAMRSWGAKSLLESGRRGEPRLVGEGYARIGEGSGSTNMLTGSGVDEAWTTGVRLGEGVIELLRENRPFTAANLEATYVRRRRSGWLDEESRAAEKARDGFQRGVTAGFFGLGLAGITSGALHLGGPHPRPYERVPSLEAYYRGRIPAQEIARIRDRCAAEGASLHDALMDRAGWPPIVHDGELLVSHQDALLLGGKVQAAPGFADHVIFPHPRVCEQCAVKLCIEICSGQAITPGEGGGVPQFDREKCVHCGACLWNCTQPREGDPDRGNLEFRAGGGGLHSAEN